MAWRLTKTINRMQNSAAASKRTVGYRADTAKSRSEPSFLGTCQLQRIGLTSTAATGKIQRKAAPAPRRSSRATRSASRAHCSTASNPRGRAARQLREAVRDEAGRAIRRQLHLSARAYHRMLKLARTITDLAGAVDIEPEHLAEALQYRPRRVEQRATLTWLCCSDTASSRDNQPRVITFSARLRLAV
jgi:Magnesium chelatase, subunit ChlI C-terminal